MLLIIGTVVGNQICLALSLVHLKCAVNPVQLDDFSPGIKQVREFVVPGAELLFKADNTLRGIYGLAELGFQKLAKFRYAQLAGKGKVVVPAGLVAVVKVFLVNDGDVPLEETVHRHPSEAGHPVFQPDFPVAVQSVAVKKELPGGLHDLIRRHAVVECQFCFCRLRTHSSKHGTAAEFRPEKNGLQRIPEDSLIGSRVFIPVKHGEQLFKFPVLIMASCGTVDDIPVNIDIAVTVIGLEVRRKGIILRAVPYDVVSAPFLKVCNSLIHHDTGSVQEKRSSFVSLPSIRAETMSSTSVLSNSSKLLLMTAIFRASRIDRPL